MPINGKIVEWQQLNLSLSIASGGNGGTAQLQSLWTPDTIDVNTVQLSAYCGSGGWGVNISEDNAYGGPYLNLPFGGYTVSSSSGADSVSIDAYFQNWRLYGGYSDEYGYVFTVIWDSLEVYVNGSYSNTFTGNTVNGGALGPTWIPIFCGLCGITGGAYSDGIQTISGGWRYQVGGTWYAPGIALPPSTTAPPTTEGGFSAPFDLPYSTPILASSTYGPMVQVGVENPGLEQTTIWGGTIYPIANLPKGVNRINNDFAATFFAYAIPQTQVYGNRQWNRDGQPGTASTVSNAIVATRAGEGSQEVGHSPGTLENFFTYPTYSIIQTSNEHDDLSGPPHGHEVITLTYPAAMDSLSGEESWSLGAHNVAPYMSHANLICNYFNSACVHPHWSTGYYTGPWNLYGGTEVWGGTTGYWGWIREQAMTGQGRRNHIVSCPLESGGWNAYLNSFFECPESPSYPGVDAGMRWIGVSRWQTEDFTPPSSLSLSSGSSGAWSVPDSSCTLSFGTSAITVTPSASPCIFRLNLSQTLYQPYLYGAISTQIGLNWPGTGISSVKVYALSEDGATSSLLAASGATTTAPGTYPFPNIPDQFYAGSWGIDNGAGAATDTGIDEAPYGMSPTVMGGVTTPEAFGFLMIGQPVAIQFAVVPTGSGDGYSTFEIDYPTLYASTSKILVHENGQISNYLYENGPGVRLGNHEFYPGVFQNPPLVLGLGYKGTVIDGLADLRLLAGVDPLTGLIGGQSLTTQCTTLYDSVEGNSVGQVDDDSNYFLLPPNPHSPTESTIRMALVNSWSEVPPLAGYPSWGRDANWNTTTGLVQQSWALCQLPRKIMSPGKRADLLNPSNTLETTAAPDWIDGWTVTQFSPVITNSESVNWQIVTNYGLSSQKLWAYVTPWHGYYANLLVRRPCLGPQRR